MAWVLSGRLNDVRRDQELLRVDLGRGLELASRDLDDFNFRARERVVELERRLGDDLGAQVAEATTTLDQLRKELSRSAGRLAELEQQLGEIVADHQDGLLDAGRRFDDLTARAIRSREELDNLRDRLDEAETTLAQGVPALVAAVADPVAPKWAVELADLASSNAGSRWNAVTALGETGDPGVIPYLTPVLKDQDVFVRMAVARVLGDLGAPEAIEPLIGALEDEEPVVREAAMVSLHAITGRNFHFDPMASTAEREKKIKAWRQWWAKARADYFGDT